MTNYQERNRRRYRIEENRPSYQSSYSDYEGNLFAEEDEFDTPQGSDYGRGEANFNQMNSPRERRTSREYDANYRNQGFSSSGQSNMGSYDRSRDFGPYQRSYDNPNYQPSSESSYPYDRRMGQYSEDYSSQRGNEYQGSHRGKGFKGWKRSDDSIYEEIGRILEQRADIDPSDVEVKVRNGEVTLEGTVPDRMTKRRMEEALDMVSGITDIQNRVRIQSQSNKGGQDGENRQSQSSQASQRTQKTTSTSSRSEN